MNRCHFLPTFRLVFALGKGLQPRVERLNLSGRRICRDLSARDRSTQRSTLSRGQSGVGGVNLNKNNHGKDRKLGNEATLFGVLRRENAIFYSHKCLVLSRVDPHHYGMSKAEYNVTRKKWANDVRRRPESLTKKILRNKKG